MGPRQRAEALPPLAPSPVAAARGGGLAAEPSSDSLLVSRSALSGSSKTPFPPDRAGLDQDFTWTRQSR